VRNAILLMDMLLIEHKAKEVQLLDRFTAGRVLARDSPRNSLHIAPFVRLAGADSRCR